MMVEEDIPLKVSDLDCLEHVYIIMRGYAAITSCLLL